MGAAVETLPSMPTRISAMFCLLDGLVYLPSLCAGRLQPLTGCRLIVVQILVPLLLLTVVSLVHVRRDLQALGSQALTICTVILGVARRRTAHRSPTNPRASILPQGTRTISVCGEMWMSHLSLTKCSSQSSTSRFWSVRPPRSRLTRAPFFRRGVAVIAVFVVAISSGTLHSLDRCRDERRCGSWPPPQSGRPWPAPRTPGRASWCQWCEAETWASACAPACLASASPTEACQSPNLSRPSA